MTELLAYDFPDALPEDDEVMVVKLEQNGAAEEQEEHEVCGRAYF